MNKKRKKNSRKFPSAGWGVWLCLVKQIWDISLCWKWAEEAEVFSSCWVCQEKNQIAAILCLNTYEHRSPILHQDRWCLARLTSRFLGCALAPCSPNISDMLFIPPILTFQNLCRYDLYTLHRTLSCPSHQNMFSLRPVTYRVVLFGGSLASCTIQGPAMQSVAPRWPLI